MSSALMSFSVLLTNSVVVDTVRSVLEGREELWFICLLVASGGVAIGCVLEIPETWADLKEWRQLRKESVELPSWRVPMAAIGLLLVVSGVIGEGVFEALISINETALRAHDEQVLADTISQAGAAKDSAGAAATASNQAQSASAGAVKTSGDALDLAEGARKEADTFEGDIVSAKKQAADAESHLADALTQAAQAKEQTVAAEKQLLELQNELRPRTLTGEQKEKLAALLREKDPEPIGVGYCWSGTECIDFANDIVDALKAANWTPTPLPRSTAAYGIEVGCLYGSDSPLMEHFIQKLMQALSDVGLPSRKTLFRADDKSIAAGFQPNVLYLVINEKPAPSNIRNTKH